MSNQSGQPPQATKSLKQFNILIGEWEMVGTHPQLPSPVKGHATFEWLKEDALLVWRTHWEANLPPDGYSVIGHDDTSDTCTVLYCDVRGVSRIYLMTLENGIWKQWRDSPDFAQRSTATFSADNNTITGHGELSRDGKTWEGDLDVTYTRRK